LKDPPDNLTPFLDEARKYAQTDYADALMKGSRLGDAEESGCREEAFPLHRSQRRLSRQGQSARHLPQFMKELQRSRGLTTGRLDARFSGWSYDYSANMRVRPAGHFHHRALHGGLEQLRAR